MRMFTMFYSYYSIVVSNSMEVSGAGKPPTEMMKQILTPRMVGHYLRQYFLPVVFSGYLLGRGPDDDESHLKWMAEQGLLTIFTGIPFARSIASSIIEGRRFQLSPAFSSVEAAGRAVSKLFTGELDRSFMGAVFTAAGTALKFPGRAIYRGLSSMHDLASGGDFFITDPFISRNKDRGGRSSTRRQ
jgi:hypothetical protein